MVKEIILKRICVHTRYMQVSPDLFIHMCTNVWVLGNVGLTGIIIPYTWVNKRIRLFSKLQENMRLIPNMRLITKGKIDHTFKTVMPSLVAHILYSK